VVGVAAAAALCYGFFKSPAAAILGVLALFALMILLVVFAALASVAGAKLASLAFFRCLGVCGVVFRVGHTHVLLDILRLAKTISGVDWNVLSCEERAFNGARRPEACRRCSGLSTEISHRDDFKFAGDHERSD